MNQKDQKEMREIAKRMFLHDPATLSRSYVGWAERLQNDPGITYGCVLDRHVIPLHPGDIMAVVARPGHGKSSFMAYMARKTAMDIVRRDAVGKECVVYVSWEQTVEEIEAFFQSGTDYSSSDMAWGRVPMDTIRRKSVKRPGLPIWAIGESIRHEGVKRPQMMIEYVYEAIRVMWEEKKIKPILLCLDYIQIIPTDGRDRTSQVHEAMVEAKQLGRGVGAAILAGVQAGRTVDHYASPIPVMSDAQHSSSIEQIADKQISLWRTARTHDPSTHEWIDVDGKRYKNDEHLLIIKLLKQRMEKGFGAWGVKFKPETLELFDYDQNEAMNQNGHPPQNGRQRAATL